ncbi:unnamed protein product, partial [Chrysoparadoxa australica]
MRTVSIGEQSGSMNGLITVVDILIGSGWMAGVYVLGALGFGRLIWKGSGDKVWVGQVGVGLALMLFVTHLLGMLGWLNPLSAWTVSGAGLLILGVSLARKQGEDSGDSEFGMGAPCRAVDVVGMIACAWCVGLMIAAACVPAGVLWDSEYGNYDSLSYHLELPRVWMEAGRITPVDWNVYSYLPSYVESAYVHMAMLGGTGNGGLGLADDGGRGIYAAQFLSVVMAVLAALVSGVVARRVWSRTCSQDDLSGRSVGRLVGWIATVLVVLTPWMVVVGTISYNESAVVLLTMCAVWIAMEDGISDTRRGLWCGLVMGAACSCKPTALFLAAPVVGAVLLAGMPVKVWWRVVLVGCFGGVVMLLPWLIRNELATGNPVFPQLSGLFGEGHWDATQHAKYAAGHSFDGGFVDRLKLLVLPDANGVTHVERFRGLTNRQWGITAGMGVFGLVVLLLKRSTHLVGVVWGLGVVLVLVAWLGLTHLQSRFLVPMVGVFGVLGGIGVGVLIRMFVQSANGLVKCVLLGIVSIVGMTMLRVQYVTQASGNPNALLVAGTDAFVGEVGDGVFDEVLWWGGVNRVAGVGLGGDGRAVYLVGDATAVYVRSPVVYNTTYDSWLIGDLMRAEPGRPGVWNQELVDRGIGWVVVNFSEVDRLAKSGWGDPDADSEALVAWAGTLGEPVMVWNGGRRVMFAL